MSDQYILLSLDPGETTGYCILDGKGKAIELGTLHLWQNLDRILGRGVTDVCIEEFRLYPWASKAQSFAKIPTIEVIGVARYLCQVSGIPFAEYPAYNKKFFSDSRLKSLGFDISILHIRDALRHGLYHLQFTKGVPIVANIQAPATKEPRRKTYARSRNGRRKKQTRRKR